MERPTREQLMNRSSENLILSVESRVIGESNSTPTTLQIKLECRKPKLNESSILLAPFDCTAVASGASQDSNLIRYHLKASSLYVYLVVYLNNADSVPKHYEITGEVPPDRMLSRGEEIMRRDMSSEEAQYIQYVTIDIRSYAKPPIVNIKYLDRSTEINQAGILLATVSMRSEEEYEALEPGLPDGHRGSYTPNRGYAVWYPTLPLPQPPPLQI